jgi:hypothetical protein
LGHLNGSLPAWPFSSSHSKQPLILFQAFHVSDSTFAIRRQEHARKTQ